MSDEHIFLRNVRCSFPHLFKAPIIDGEEGSCGVVLLLEPGDDHTTDLQAQIKALSTAKHKRVLPADKVCMRPGADKRVEYGDLMAVSANVKKGRTPLVLGAGRTVVTGESQCAIYPGCRVTAKIRLWSQDNKFGKRINAELIAIQFVGDDEPLDDSYVSQEDAMAGFDESEEAAKEDEFFDL